MSSFGIDHLFDCRIIDKYYVIVNLDVHGSAAAQSPYVTKFLDLIAHSDFSVALEVSSNVSRYARSSAFDVFAKNITSLNFLPFSTRLRRILLSKIFIR